MSGIFTSIDFVAFDKTRAKFVLIELKTGYDRGYSSALVSDAPLPLIERADSFATRHALQLVFMDWALERLVGVPRGVYYSCVVRASNDARVRVHEPQPLPRWAVQNADNIVALLREQQRK